MSQKPRVLVVDDHARNVAILEKILRKDHDLRSAATGEEALAIAGSFQPDLILLDIMMPGIDGYETCRRLRAMQFRNIPKIIMVSARARIEERLMGYDAGADDYVTKPFDSDELYAKVCVYLRLKSAEEIAKLREEILLLLCHETRTPLSGLIGASDVIASMPDVSPELAEMISVLRESSTWLHDLFEKAITLSSLRSGTVSFEKMPVDLASLVRSGVERRLEDWPGGQVELNCDASAQHVALMDPNHVESVLSPLLDLAFAAKSPASRARIEVTADANDVRMRVEAPGFEVSAEVLARIFDGFVSPDIAHHTKGHGLSLAITREVVLGLGGEISAEPSPTGGARFEFRVPSVAIASDAASPSTSGSGA